MNITQIKFGKKMFDDCFNTSINKEVFLKLIKEIETKVVGRKKKYYIYTSLDKYLLIFTNGLNKCYQIKNYVNIDRLLHRIEKYDKHFLSNDAFEPDYEYDNIYEINEKIYDNVSFIEKRNMKTNTTIYNIVYDYSNNSNISIEDIGNMTEILNIEKEL